MRQRFKDLATTFIDVVLPPACANCRRAGEMFCQECQAQVIWITEPVCKRCGRTQEAAIGDCAACRYDLLPLNRIRAATFYTEPVRPVIHQLKYDGYYALARPLAELMIAAWPKWGHGFDLVVPIPLHPERRRKRGYNQAQLLVEEMALYFDWRCDYEALERRRHTRPQVGLTAKERRINVRGAFVADKSRVAGKRVMLVDDLYTTGSTLAAAADVLLEAGACSVTAYCLAGSGEGFNTLIA